MSRQAFPILCHKTQDVRLIGGTFQINAGADPDVLCGNGWSVARTAAGKYTVTLDETFHRCVSVTTDIGETGDDKDNNCHHEEIDLTTTFSSFVVRTQLAAADTETDNQQVSFICLVANNSNVNQRAS